MRADGIAGREGGEGKEGGRVGSMRTAFGNAVSSGITGRSTGEQMAYGTRGREALNDI